MSIEEYPASPDRPKWLVDPTAGEIRRTVSDSSPGEVIAKYDAESGVVELPKEHSNYRLSIINVMKGANGGHFDRFGTIGLDEKAPKDAPPKPKKSYKLGEKSPGRVEWEARHTPQTFLDRWGVDRMQTRTGYESIERIRTKDDGSGDREKYIEKVPVYKDVNHLRFDVDDLLDGKQRLIARAKTILTHIAHESPDLNEYDDSLDQEDDDRI